MNEILYRQMPQLAASASNDVTEKIITLCPFKRTNANFGMHQNGYNNKEFSNSVGLIPAFSVEFNLKGGLEVIIYTYDENGRYTGVFDPTWRSKVTAEIGGFFNFNIRYANGRVFDLSEINVKITAPKSNYLFLSKIAHESDVVDVAYALSDVSQIQSDYASKLQYFEQVIESQYQHDWQSEKIGSDYLSMHDVNAYTLTPPNFKRTILATSHMHGDEKYCFMGWLSMLIRGGSGLYQHYIYDELVNKTRWIVIPVVSPQAYIAGTRATNGVDLNRNFDYNFTANADSGSAAESQVESENLASFMRERRADIDYFIDLHDTPSVSTFSHAPAMLEKTKLCTAMYRAMDLIIDASGGTRRAPFVSTYGSARNYAMAVLGIPSVTVEHVVHYWLNRGLSLSEQIGKAEELIVNILSTLIKSDAANSVSNIVSKSLVSSYKTSGSTIPTDPPSVTSQWFLQNGYEKTGNYFKKRSSGDVIVFYAESGDNEANWMLTKIAGLVDLGALALSNKQLVFFNSTPSVPEISSLLPKIVCKINSNSSEIVVETSSQISSVFSYLRDCRVSYTSVENPTGDNISAANVINYSFNKAWERRQSESEEVADIASVLVGIVQKIFLN